jgi:hypothetical protein
MVKRVMLAGIVYSGPVRGYAHKSCRLERGGSPAITDLAGYGFPALPLPRRFSWSRTCSGNV